MKKRLFFCTSLLAIALTALTSTTSVPNARADSTSTTLNLYLGGYVIYQGVRYLQAKAKVDSNVRSATSIVTAAVTKDFGIDRAPAPFWFASNPTPPPDGVVIPPVRAPSSDLGDLRNEVLYATYYWVPAASFTPTPAPASILAQAWSGAPAPTPTAPARLQYETLRSCWNAMIFANVSSANSAAPASALSNMFPTPAPTPTPTAKPTQRRGHGSPHAETGRPVTLMGLMDLNASDGGHGSSGNHSGHQGGNQTKPKSTAKPTNSPKSSPTPSPKPTPSPTPTPGAVVDTSSCAQTAAKYEPSGTTWVDAIDAVNAFSSATPPLLQQIIDTNVQSYSDANSLRADVNWILGAKYVESAWAQKFKYVPKTGAGGLLTGLPVPQVVTDCYSKQNATACAQDLGAIEAAAEKAYENGAACSFASKYWLPTYTAIRRASPPPLSGPAPSYGAAPGCSS